MIMRISKKSSTFAPDFNSKCGFLIIYPTHSKKSDLVA